MEISNLKIGSGGNPLRPLGEGGGGVFLLGPPRIQPQNSAKRRCAALQKGAPFVLQAFPERGVGKPYPLGRSLP